MEKGQLVPYLRQRIGLVTRTAMRRMYITKAQESAVVDSFHRLYYESEAFGGTWRSTTWMGIPLKKCPMDLWVYQEMIHELKPELIVETGTWRGGSALYLAALCDCVGRGRVVSIDTAAKGPLPSHPRIQFVAGSSTDPEVFRTVQAMVPKDAMVLVILDSYHSCQHVLDELRLYSPLVPVGGYLIVEDSNVNGHPVAPEYGPGPMEAIDSFLAESDAFEVDPAREKFYMTFNPEGYLRRTR
jgi:cephalosporin hydroxylase